MNNCTIFVSSCDKYSDIWGVFFDMFQRFWPEYKGEIVLNTETRDYHHEGLNIRCTKVGKEKSFGETFRAGLNQIHTDNVLFIQEDFMFMGKVDNKAIEEYYDFFLKHNLDSLYLKSRGFLETAKTDDNRIVRAVIPKRNMSFSFRHAPKNLLFCFQIGFWKKDVLKEMVLPHESPWTAEWYGSMRADRMKINTGCIREDVPQPIPYHYRGCLQKGKWLPEAVKFLEEQHYDCDFSKRGIDYDDKTMSHKYWKKFTIDYFLTGLKGSYWDMWRRKPIH